MAAAIRDMDVMDALRPWLGWALVSNTDIASTCAEILRGYAPYKQTLDDLREILDKHIFHTLHHHLGISMSVSLDDGRIRRIMVRDIETITDDLLGVLFDSLSVYSVNYELLNMYALTHESLASLRVLYQKYRDMMNEAEFSMVVTIIKNTYPPARYQRWMKD